MAGVQVEAGSAMAQAIQSVVQPKLMENGWVAEENDTTLSEYVTMMVVGGKDGPGVMSELGGDLLGVGEDDPAVGAFAEWLFEQVRALAAPTQQQGNGAGDAQATKPESHAASTAQDAQMDDTAPTGSAPSGPKAMRNGAAGARGRGGRLLGQMNNHMNRQDLPDPLRRIKGAASGQQGRINSHVGKDAPRGPKNQNFANGVQRLMNGNGRNTRSPGAQMNPMMPGNAMNGLDPQQQMAFMQMMEMQANLMTQMMHGAVPAMQQNNGQSRSMFDRVDKKQMGNLKGRQARQHEDHSNNEAGTGMEVDPESAKKDPFDIVCRFNSNCTNSSCGYAHQSPSAPPGQTIDMTDTCSFGAACENRKCAGRHSSPAQRAQHLKQEVDCKFYPNCTNPNCPFKHPDMPLCRNGADCNVEGCQFTHSKIMCRYTPCQRPQCPFKHVEGQRGVFKDKVWTKDGAPNTGDGSGEAAADDGKSNRFAGLKANETQPEELIIPGIEMENSASSQVFIS